MTLKDFLDSFHWLSLLLIVLDAFHFDHETLSKEIELAKNRKPEGENVTTATLYFLLSFTALLD